WSKSKHSVEATNIFNDPEKDGEILTISTEPANMFRMANEDQMMQLKEYESEPQLNFLHAALGLILIVGVVITAALRISELVISAMVGCLLMILFGLIKPEEAYAAIEWKVIFLLAGVLSMGVALQKTGGAKLIAQG